MTDGKIVKVPFLVLDESQFDGHRGVRDLFHAMKSLYDGLKTLRGKPQIRRLRLVKQQRSAMERGLRYLDFIVNQGIIQKRLFRRRADQDRQIRK